MGYVDKAACLVVLLTLCRQVNRLKELGPAGMVSYGLLNSCYYTSSYIYCLHKVIILIAVNAQNSLCLQSNLATRRQFIELALIVWVRAAGHIDCLYPRNIETRVDW